MDYYIYDIDKYQPLEQSNKFAPIWPFRIGVFGSSDSGKTTMLINLLMGDKKIKEDGERYILCNDVVDIDPYCTYTALQMKINIFDIFDIINISDIFDIIIIIILFTLFHLLILLVILLLLNLSYL